MTTVPTNSPYMITYKSNQVSPWNNPVKNAYDWQLKAGPYCTTPEENLPKQKTKIKKDYPIGSLWRVKSEFPLIIAKKDDYDFVYLNEKKSAFFLLEHIWTKNLHLNYDWNSNEISNNKYYFNQQYLMPEIKYTSYTTTVYVPQKQQPAEDNSGCSWPAYEEPFTYKQSDYNEYWKNNLPLKKESRQQWGNQKDLLPVDYYKNPWEKYSDNYGKEQGQFVGYTNETVKEITYNCTLKILIEGRSLIIDADDMIYMEKLAA
jgi:hypothetical protein